MSVADFYTSEPREVGLALEGYKTRQKEEFTLHQIATYNAIGLNFQKKFKTHDPFNEEVENTITAEEKERELNYLKQKFNVKEGENS